MAETATAFLGVAMLVSSLCRLMKKEYESLFFYTKSQLENTGYEIISSVWVEYKKKKQNLKFVLIQYILNKFAIC